MSLSQHIKEDGASVEKLQVNVLLEGPDAKRFLAFKQKQRVRANAEVARMLISDQLDRVEALEAAAVA